MDIEGRKVSSLNTNVLTSKCWKWYVEGSVEGSVEDSVEEINLKELSEEEDFSKNKIIVDESFSVNQLKSICKNLGLQLSGNKTTLIKRIMDNQ